MLNIVIPMAGRGSRFTEAGYADPKPLIDIYGHHMIEYVIKNLTPLQEHQFTFICQKEHIKRYNIDKTLRKMAPGCNIVTIDHITEGAACTVLLAEEHINNQNPLMIANSDQYVDIDINQYLNSIHTDDGLIMTMPASDPKWSYIKYDQNGTVTMVREKEVISDQATVGIYNYKAGEDFVRYAKEMIRQNMRVNNEFYVAPVYNLMIEDGYKIGYYDIKDKMYGLGVPEDLNYFMEQPIAKKVFIQ